MKLKTIYCCLSVLLLQISCSRDKKNETIEIATASNFCLSEQLKKTTVISPIEFLPISETLMLSGKVEYDENDLLAFHSLLQGTAEKVNFELGDFVKTGQILANIKSTQIQELYQQELVAQNQITLIKKQIQQKKALLKDGLISEPELITAEHELANVQFDLEKTSEILKMYSSNGQGAFYLKAPKSGYIVQKAISPGQTISDDQHPLFTLSNLKKVWVMVNIYANNLKFIKVGDQVKVKTLANPEVYHQGIINKIYNVFDDNEHVLKARVVLENPDLKLLPGLAADIIITKTSADQQTNNAFAIPNEATVFHDNKTYVVLTRNDGTFYTKMITKLASNEQYTFVNESFEEQEQVIRTNALLIFEELQQ